MRRRQMRTESVAARIKRLREARGLTQQSLAVEIGAAVQSVSRWESEQRAVLPQRLYRRALAAALGVSVDYLMTGAERSVPTGSERRLPVLQPLREVVGRVQTAGEDVLSDFVSRVVQIAQQEGWLRRGRR